MYRRVGEHGLVAFLGPRSYIAEPVSILLNPSGATIGSSKWTYGFAISISLIFLDLDGLYFFLCLRIVLRLLDR